MKLITDSTVEECLNKFKAQFKDLEMVGYLIDNVVIPYSQCGDENYYQEYMIIASKDVFTLRCRCGFVYILLEYNEDVFGATIENIDTRDSVFFQNKMPYNVGEINQKIYSIID